MFNKVRIALSGKKAYLVGAITVLLGVLTQDMKVILDGIAIMALRAGIHKINN